MNAPTYLAYDPTGDDLYLSDSGNNLVRKMDLMSGWVSVGPGRVLGQGNALENQVERTMTVQQNPRGLAILPQFGRHHLVYADRSGTNCHARVVNFDTVARSLLGSAQSIVADSVYTILGPNGLACATYNGSSGAAATTPQFLNPEGVAIDGGLNLYMADETSHVIVKMVGNPSSANYGKVYTYMGLSANAGSAVGNTGDPNTTRLSSPTGIAVDPRNAGDATQDGNLFVTDITNQRILYVNRKTSIINQDAFSGNGDLEALPAANSSNGSVTAISQWTPGQVRGLATFGNQICFASLTYHNVQCYSRTDLSTRTLLVGPGGTGSENSGGTYSNELEGVPASAARLWSPYGLTFDAEGNLYIADQNNHMVRKVARWPAVQD
jgi:hypothetical protein